MTAALVSLIGPPASGKTTVAGWLAAALGARLILEDYAGNPFLAESYAGRTELRLSGQAWFLLSRVNQLARARWPERGAAVSDYAYLQDQVYARILLPGEELQTYAALAARVAPLVHPPELLIWLDGPVELLKDRIAKRGRDYERHFTDAFLRRQIQEYGRLLERPACAAIRVDIAARDLRQAEHQQWLLAQVRAELGRAQSI